MRVAFVNENIGGHATVHFHLRKALADRGDIGAVFLDVPPPTGARRLLGAGVPGLAQLDLDLQPLRAQLGLSLFVRRWLRRHASEFDGLHIYTQNAALLSTRILTQIPTVITCDSTNELNAYRLPQRPPTRWTPRLLPLAQTFERRVYEAATLVVANSEWVAGSLRSTYLLSDDKIRIFPFGVPVPDLLPPAPPGPPTITFVGRQLERKGGLRLLRLFNAQLAARCTLNLVTQERVPPYSGVRVFNNITVGDARLTDLLRGSAAFVLPTMIDQSPNSVLEAMALGVPVVVSRVGALPEMVKDGVTGFVVDPDDDDQLIQAITTLLDDRALRAQMGLAAHDWALERYEVGKTTSALVGVLREASSLFHSARSRRNRAAQDPAAR